MNGKWLILILLTTLVGVLSGCGTIPPATVTPQAIRNPKVGYDGYELRIPDGYRVADIKTNAPEVDLTLSANATWLQERARQQQGAGGRVLFYESYLVFNGKFTVLFAAKAMQLQGPAISMLSDFQVRHTLEREMEWWREYTSGREVVTVGDHLAGWVTIDRVPDLRPSTACRVVLVPGKYNEVFFFVACSATEDKDGLDPFLQDLVRGLKF